MLRAPNSEPSADAGRTTATIADVLRSASTAAYGRLADDAVDPARWPGWVGLADLQAQPRKLMALVEAAGQDRFHSPDQALVLAQVTREAVAVLATAATYMWSVKRRLLDLSIANVALHEGPSGVQVAMRTPRLAVLPGDALARFEHVEVLDEAAMVSRLLDGVIGHGERATRGGCSSASPTTSSTDDAGPPVDGSIGTIITTARRLHTMGDRHLWGSVALAVAGALTKSSHVTGIRADEDRATLFAARPDLARLVELVTVCDADGGPLTFAARRTCCLLYKLPQRTQCATCSLRDPDEQLEELTVWHISARRSLVRQSAQSTGSRPASTSAAFVREKGRLPKKPLDADRGEGCGDSTTV
jgi:hypothetical protein